MDLATLFQARQYLTLKDHAPGALRLGVNPAILGDARFKGLASGATPLPRGVLGLDVNVFAMTVTLRYDAQALPDEQIRAFFSPGQAEAEAALAALQQTLEQGRA